MGLCKRAADLSYVQTHLGVFAKFTDADDRIFQASYTRCSERGSHDPSSELNRSLPELSELVDDLQTIVQWSERVRKYKD